MLHFILIRNLLMLRKLLLVFCNYFLCQYNVCMPVYMPVYYLRILYICIL